MEDEVQFFECDGKPPIVHKVVVLCVADMTDAERDEYFRTQPADRQLEHNERKKNGYYNRCSKTDWCQKAREEKEQKDKEVEKVLLERVEKLEIENLRLADLAGQVLTLEAREAVWVEHAKKQEEQIHKAQTAMKKMEANIEKLASLVAQLLPK